MKMHSRYIPIYEAEAGMVLGAPVSISNHGYLSLSLSAGHVLSENALYQLSAHGAQYISIAEPDPRSEEQIAEDAALVTRRLNKIFAGADLADPSMAALFEQVMIYRSE